MLQSILISTNILLNHISQVNFPLRSRNEYFELSSSIPGCGLGTNEQWSELGKPNQTDHATWFGYTNLTQTWDTYLKLEKIARKGFIGVTLSRKEVNSYVETCGEQLHKKMTICWVKITGLPCFCQYSVEVKRQQLKHPQIQQAPHIMIKFYRI